MNGAYKSLLVLCCTAVLFGSACRKTAYNTPGPTITNAGEANLNQLFSGLRTTPQSIVVTAGSSQTVYGANGTKLTFYPNSFKDKDGNVIKKGVVNIQLTEIYSLGDMIANRAATTSNGVLLTSGGQVLVTATMNGQEVFANKYGIGFRHAGASQQPMSLFYGNTNNADSVVNWTTATVPQPGTYVPSTVTSGDSSVVVVITSGGQDTITTHGAIMNYYQFDSCASFNWINCDYFYTSNAELTDVRVMVPDTSFNQSNTEVFIVFPAINAAAHMTQYNTTTHTFDLPKGYYIPVGMPVDIIAATNKNGVYYYFCQTGVTTTSNMFVYAEMSLTSLTYIKQHIHDL